MSENIELAELATSFAEFLRDEWPRERAVSHGRNTESLPAALWEQVAGLGWTALTAPEAQGGLGLGLDAVATLHYALGASAAPLPLLGNELAIAVLQAVRPNATSQPLIEALAAGTERAVVITSPAAGLVLADGVLNGVVHGVPDAATSTQILLPVLQSGATLWLIIPSSSAGLALEVHPLADGTRTLATLSFTDCTIAAALEPASDEPLFDHLLRHACVALAADSIGSGDAVLAATIEYMMVREQFDRVIGSFQALKHRVADHKAALEAARGLVDYAASLQQNAPDALLAALTAKQHATRAAAEVARDCIQLHGGVGYTSEYVPHIYLKRTKLNEVLFGTRTELLDRIADMLEAA